MNRFPPPFRRPPRSATTLRRLTVAALVVVPLAACGTASDDTLEAASIGDASATTGAPVVPSATPGGTDSESIVVEGPGTGSVFFAGAEHVQVAVPLPAGWVTESSFVGKKDSDPIIHLAFFDVANIYADPCRYVLLDPPVGPTVDDLVAAFQASTVFDTTPDRYGTLDGHPGKYIEVTVPNYDEESCMLFGLFKEEGETDAGPDWWAQAPQQTIQMWILDVDGTRLVVSAGHYPHTTDQDRQALTDMVATLDIE